MDLKTVRSKLRDIRLIGFDFDGTFTDGRVFFGQDGYEAVVCSRKDSLGISMLRRNGIHTAVISKETSPVVAARCRKMDVPCYQAIETGDGKRDVLKRITAEMNISSDHVAFMGDDVNDIAALEWAGVGIVVAGAHPLAQLAADHVTERRGGEHAVREVCELILHAKGLPITA